METDLLGDEITKPKKISKGYAGNPGAGPAGEKCKTCKHITSNWYAFKCGLVNWREIGGACTDIRINAAACQRWEGK